MSKRRASPDQLDLFAEEKVAPIPQVDDLEERLIAAGFAPNGYILYLNRELTTPYEMKLDAPWSLPSRLFRFPIEFMSARRGNGPSRLLLRHPLLGDHPFVRQVEQNLGITIGWEATDEFGRPFGGLPKWWHAVDLTTDKHWQDVCCTIQFTTRDNLIAAIALGVSFSAGCEGAAKKRSLLAIDTARYMLGTLGAEEPADRSAAFLSGKGLWPGHIVEHHPRTGKKTSERWAVNIHDHGPAGAWAHIHGIEDGWFFRDRGGFLQVSAEGLRRREPQAVAA